MAYPRGAPKPAGSGRKKGTPNKRTEAVKQVLDGYANSEGIPMLKRISKDKKTPLSLRVDVSKYLIDRELGRPRQAQEIEVKQKSLEELLAASWEPKGAK